jgi:serine/threonine-protein kinase
MGYIELALRREGRFARLYALKRPHRQMRDDPAFAAMFLDEGRIAGLIRHANVVSVLDVGEDAEGPYLAMDYVEGVSAASLLERAAREGERLPLAFCIGVAAQAARGLHAAHELEAPDGRPLGLVHRDVSPQNLLIGYDGVVRVTDFGIAKAVGNINRTTTGVLKGNVGYMSPEQLRFQEPDRRSDVFSLAVVLFELLAGRRLYHETDVGATARRVLEEAPPDIGELRADVPPELGGLMFEMLAKDPALRPATAEEAARRLEAILVAVEVETEAVDLADPLRRWFGARRAEVAGAVQRALQEDSLDRQGPRRWLLPAAAALVVAAAVPIVSWRRPSVPVSGLWCGDWHTCATRDAVLHCWGKNNEGQLGDGATLNASTRHSVKGVGDVASVAGGRFHTCAARPDGSVVCWGRNAAGQIGVAGVDGSKTAIAVPGLQDVVQLAAGGTDSGEDHTCALRRNGRVLCWGDNRHGQLGVAGPPSRASPSEVPGVTDVVQIDAGGASTCARTRSGGVYCWGAGGAGQLGRPVTEQGAPQAVPGIQGATAVSVGLQFACALRAAGEVWCWGNNGDGQLGAGPVGSGARRPEPGRVLQLPPARQVAALQAAACALTLDGDVYCWGRGDWGNLGNGARGPKLRQPIPRAVGGVKDVAFLAAGGAHVCVRRIDHAILCWGHNENGQLGDGTHDSRPEPVSVTGFP